MQGRISAPVQPMPNGEMPMAWSRGDMNWRGESLPIAGSVGRIVVTHNLGLTPGAVFIQITATGNNYTNAVIAKDGATFTVQFKNAADGTFGTSGQTVSFWWMWLQ
jgi:hypothetical protein